ncbi:MAG TPA: serine hydrolase domain-containing protein, partial [Flavobacteriaceae bacterium]|nr:serine hydrolase domain-containing protein [Flavobacteriaceae bacterium]
MANKEENVKTEPSTLCSICSVSKLFTAVAIMKLYDEGKIRLDDNIEDILPWYNLKQQYLESGPITIRSLLSHSSGLPRENTFSHWNGPDYYFPSKEEIKERLSSQETLYPASTYYQYSNLALTLLGYVVEEITGETYEDYVKENILSPLGLSNTSPTMPKSLHGNQLAIGYGNLSRDGKRTPLNFFEANGVNAAAGFSSNVEDLAKFASWQFRLRDTTVTEILKPSTLKNMHNVHWIDADWEGTRGLGFGIYKGPNGDKWVGHGGYCPGYQTTFRLHLDSKLAYTVMINANGVNPPKYAYGIHKLLMKVKTKEKEEVSEDKLDLSSYIGYYNWDIAEETYVALWEGKLALIDLPTNSPAESMTLYKHIEGDTFKRIRDDGELGEKLLFERDANGNVVQMKIFENYIYTKAKS